MDVGPRAFFDRVAGLPSYLGDGQAFVDQERDEAVAEVIGPDAIQANLSRARDHVWFNIVLADRLVASDGLQDRHYLPADLRDLRRLSCCAWILKRHARPLRESGRNEDERG